LANIKQVLSKLNHASTTGDVDRAILNFIKKKKLIIHGAKAINAQAPFHLQRATRDYDVYTNQPKRNIELLDKELDQLRQGNYHYVKKGKHKGTYKLKDIGQDLKRGTKDDFTLTDFTQKPKGLRTIRKNNIFFSHLNEIKKTKVRTLAKEQFKFRHKKDRADVKIIDLIIKGGML
jgi:hypothetical protein